MFDDRFDVVIGLEVHVQLNCRSKLFCGCAYRFAGEPNNQTCPVCFGLPGALPVLNQEAVAKAIRFALAIGTRPQERSCFDRKNYFYPDLPKGYQITQYQAPIITGGAIYVEAQGQAFSIAISRAHLEEDSGQSLHMEDRSAINFNRAGVPLLEIVTEPEIHHPDLAYAFLRQLRTLVRYHGISNGNMEEGSMRCDANISLRAKGQETLGTRTEIKNLNSINGVRRALTYEMERQRDLLLQGEPVVGATLLWDAALGQTKMMRLKEESADYRYFPEPDLPTLVVTRNQIAEIEQTMAVLPQQRVTEYRKLGFHPEDTWLLFEHQDLASYFHEILTHCEAPITLMNWVKGEFLREMKQPQCHWPSPKDFASLINAIHGQQISGKMAKSIFEVMVNQGIAPDDMIQKETLRQISDSEALAEHVKEVLAAFPQEVQKFRDGKKQMVGFFMGELMKRTAGKANPKGLKQVLLEQLSS